jgi:hypothetical protein
MEYDFYKEPTYVGYWQLVPPPVAFKISTTHKPNWFHRFMVKLMFGWTWHEGSVFK